MRQNQGCQEEEATDVTFIFGRYAIKESPQSAATCSDDCFSQSSVTLSKR